jgi:hypothetical protein
MRPAADISIAADNFLHAVAIDSEVHLPVLCNLEVITQLQMACIFFSCLNSFGQGLDGNIVFEFWTLIKHHIYT